jgi:hypothetical protein
MSVVAVMVVQVSFTGKVSFACELKLVRDRAV